MGAELPKQNKESLNKREKFILENTKTLFKESILDDKLILKLIYEFYSVINNEEIQKIFEILKDGSEQLKKILLKNKSNWSIRSNMYIPSTKHVHISILDYLSDTEACRLTFKDDETFKISRFNIYQILALMTYKVKFYRKSQAESDSLMMEAYDELLQNISQEQRGVNNTNNIKVSDKFISEIAENLLVKLEKEYQKYEKLDFIKPYTLQTIGDNLGKNPFFKLVDHIELSEEIYKMNLFNAEDEFISINKPNFIQKIKSILQQNQNGILDFYCRAYFHTYNCGQIDFKINDEGVILILEGKTSCDKNSGIKYLLNFIYSLSSNTEKTAVQSSQYDIKFTGLINEKKLSELHEKPSDDEEQKNYPFPLAN